MAVEGRRDEMEYIQILYLTAQRDYLTTFQMMLEKLEKIPELDTARLQKICEIAFDFGWRHGSYRIVKFFVELKEEFAYIFSQKDILLELLGESDHHISIYGAKAESYGRIVELIRSEFGHRSYISEWKSS